MTVKKTAEVTRTTQLAATIEKEDTPPGGPEDKACCSATKEERMAKSLDELKAERTTAKRLFSRLANNIIRTYVEMSVEELMENFKKLTVESSRLMEANDEVEAAYMAESEAEELFSTQRADIERTEKECQQKTKEVKLLIQETLWVTYGEKELSLALQVAQTECENVSSTEPDTTLETYEFLLTHLEKLVHKRSAPELEPLGSTCREKRPR